MVATGRAQGAAGRGMGGRTLAKRLLTGWVLAFAVTGGYWGMSFMPLNRWGMYFTRLDFWAVLFLTVSLGTVLGVGAFVLERWVQRARALLVASFWGWAAVAFANNHPALYRTVARVPGFGWMTEPVWLGTVWAVGLAGVAAALLVPGWRRVSAAAWRFTRRYLWLLFLVPVLLWHVPTLEAAFGGGLDFGRVPGNGRPATVLLMFDMLGYEELFDEAGAVRPGYTNFAAFCETADVYHDASSAGVNTAVSIPGFIVQKRLAGTGWDVPEVGDWLFTDGTESFRARDYAGQSLPAAARAAGGRAQAIGTYVPWDSLLPGVWDATESMGDRYGNRGVHVFGVEPTFRTAAKEHLVWYFAWVSKSPLAAVAKAAGLVDYAASRGYDKRISLLGRAGRMLREGLSPGDFFFIHANLPHNPYLVGRGGARLPASLYFDDVAGLAAQTEGTDWALGEVLAAIASTPAGRDAWIVVTSDHNLRTRHLRGPKTHVPFLVHRPGQAERRDIAAPADLADLRHVLPDLPIFGGEAGGHE